MRQKPITAGDLMRQLAADPEYQERMRKQEADRLVRSAVEAADEVALVAELRNAGYDVSSVWDLVNNVAHPVLPPPRFTGPYPKAYPILVHHLDIEHRAAVREGIIRALTVRDAGNAVADALLSAFDRETDAGLRWVLANALRSAMPYSRRRRRPDIAATFRRGSGA